MIKDNLVLFSSDKLYNEHINDVSPESLAFVSKGGEEKLITQNKTFFFVPSNGSSGQVLKYFEGYLGWETLNTARESTNAENLNNKNTITILTVSSDVEGKETKIHFTNSFENGQTTTVYITKATDSKFDPILVIDEGEFNSINGQYRLVIKDGEWTSIKFYKGSSSMVYAEVNDFYNKLNELANNVVFLHGVNETGATVDNAVMMNGTNVTKNVYEFSIGRYNNSSRGTSGQFGPEDKLNTLLTVGNGLDDEHRHNAFQVGQKGEIEIVDLSDERPYYEKGSFVLQDKLREQDERIAELTTKIGELEERLAQCCASVNEQLEDEA